MPFFISKISELLGLTLVQFPLEIVNSGLKKFNFITLILFSSNILINSFNIAASPFLAALIILGI